MATVQTVIDRALRLISQIGAGEDPTSDETADALTALNAMLDSWRNDKLMCFAFQTETLTLANADSSYTIGTSGDLNTTRPVEIVEAWIEDGDITYPVRLISEAEYAAILDKTESGDWPDKLLFRPTVASSQATVIVHPVPNATRTLKLITRVVVSAFSTASDNITLPPGWEDAMAKNLAIQIAPEYEVEPSPNLQKMAAQSLAAIKRTNAASQPKRMYTDLAMLSGHQQSNIYSG